MKLCYTLFYLHIVELCWHLVIYREDLSPPNRDLQPEFSTYKLLHVQVKILTQHNIYGNQFFLGQHSKEKGED